MIGNQDSSLLPRWSAALPLLPGHHVKHLKHCFTFSPVLQSSKRDHGTIFGAAQPRKKLLLPESLSTLFHNHYTAYLSDFPFLSSYRVGISRSLLPSLRSLALLAPILTDYWPQRVSITVPPNCAGL